MRVARLHTLWFSFLLPISSGHQKASGAAPKAKVCFFGGTARAQAERSAGPKDGGGAETRRAAGRKQKTAVPPGAARRVCRQAKRCPRDEGSNKRQDRKSGNESRMDLLLSMPMISSRPCFGRRSGTLHQTHASRGRPSQSRLCCNARVLLIRYRTKRGNTVWRDASDRGHASSGQDALVDSRGIPRTLAGLPLGMSSLGVRPSKDRPAC